MACGVSVDPVLRGMPIAPREEHDLVLVAVGEGDLDAVLAAIPASHRDRVVLLQNELLPPSWRARGIVDPTVLVVWFEKKAGRALERVRDTEVYGPAAPLFVRALEAMDVHSVTLSPSDVAPSDVVPSDVVPSDVASRELVRALVVKNLYIVGANVLGLALEREGVGAGTTGALVTVHRARTEGVLRELLAIEHARLGPDVALDDDDVIARTLHAFLADPTHGTLGRTAQARLERALTRARAHGVACPTLERIAVAAEG